MPVQQFVNHITAASSHAHIFFWLSHTSTSHKFISKRLAAFLRRLLANWWKTKDTFHRDFCQTLEGMLVKLGFELITLDLSAQFTID